MESHLLQMRGLKRNAGGGAVCRLRVASFTDAWIETRVLRMLKPLRKSHLLQMRGLKLQECHALPAAMSHLLQMRGLKQQDNDINAFRNSRIFYRCVD